MSGAVCVIYVKNAKNAIFEAYDILHVSGLDMAIWVSKVVSEPQECRPKPLNNFSIGLMAKNLKNLTIKIFLCIF